MKKAAVMADPAADYAQPWWTRHNATYLVVHIFWTVRGHR